ncbi:MAG: 2-phospho-L-lactate transferase [Gammaproteobacteria bacterium]|nr:2-phospho-L-lactate transferase [Gammaproteobacteria bacterium]MDE0226565.1 2-phospho-L-lactate transferase [Gammaproteobacteria bacterium]
MKVLALTGGIGGAKLALGLAKVLAPDEVAFVVNTGDDFEHLGFHIAPDVDTLVYTLAGEANIDTGWGRHDESWHFMHAAEQFGLPTWFRLGDRDLALHVYRRQRLAEGATLTEVTRETCRRLGVAQPVLPMSNDPVRTRVLTPDGPLAFQHYFVRDRCEPAVTGFEFDGVEDAAINPEISALLAGTSGDGLRAIVICPSNPFVSVDPILALPGMRDMLRSAGVPIIAVSPIVGGRAIKGPTAKMMRELDIPAAAAAVARHYRDLITGFVLDECDASRESEVADLGLATTVTQTVMLSLDDRIALARDVLAFAGA